MTIRPYKYGEDFEAVKSFMTDERTHALWSAGIFGYPLMRESFENKLRELEAGGDIPYVALGDEGEAEGFFLLSNADGEGRVMLKFVIVAPSQRGRGTGRQMVSLAVEQAFGEGADVVALCVFSVNDKARRCYLSAGFEEKSVTPGAFSYNGEIWGRCALEIRREG